MSKDFIETDAQGREISQTDDALKKIEDMAKAARCSKLILVQLASNWFTVSKTSRDYVITPKRKTILAGIKDKEKAESICNKLNECLREIAEEEKESLLKI